MGLVVFNLIDNSELCKGTYVWNGSKWKSLQDCVSFPLPILNDPQSSVCEGYTYKVTNMGDFDSRTKFVWDITYNGNAYTNIIIYGAQNEFCYIYFDALDASGDPIPQTLDVKINEIAWDPTWDYTDDLWRPFVFAGSPVIQEVIRMVGQP